MQVRVLNNGDIFAVAPNAEFVVLVSLFRSARAIALNCRRTAGKQNPECYFGAARSGVGDIAAEGVVRRGIAEEISLAKRQFNLRERTRERGN